MLESFQINVRLEIILQTMVWSVNFLRSVQFFFCSGSRDIGRVPMTSVSGGSLVRVSTKKKAFFKMKEYEGIYTTDVLVTI